MLCIQIGYPDREHEKEVLTNHRDGDPLVRLEPALTGDQLLHLQAAVRDVRVDESINDYLLDIVTATRHHPELQLGVSTRGALTLYRAVQSLALVEGRNFAIPDDVKRLASPVLAHRVVAGGLLREGQRERCQHIIRQILDRTPVPE
jgi:MoxR-like ATPase